MHNKNLITIPIILIIVFSSIPFIIKKIKYYKEDKDKSVNQAHYNTLISINDEQTNITLIQNKIKPLIDKIIKEELKEDIKDMEFHIKPRHDITLYYLNDFKKGQEKIIEEILSKLENEKITLNNLKLSTSIDFFGDLNELVILINEPNELMALNSKIKKYINELNKEFEKLNKNGFFNQQKSEFYTYKPHITLGRIPKKQSFLGSEKDKDKIINKIKDRIKKEVFPKIYDLIKQNDKLSASKITFYKIPKSSYTISLANQK